MPADPQERIVECKLLQEYKFGTHQGWQVWCGLNKIALERIHLHSPTWSEGDMAEKSYVQGSESKEI